MTDPGQSGSGPSVWWKTTRGYRNLCRLLTRRHRQENLIWKPRLPNIAAGLTVMTPDAGLLQRPVQRRHPGRSGYGAQTACRRPSAAPHGRSRGGAAGGNAGKIFSPPRRFQRPSSAAGHCRQYRAVAAGTGRYRPGRRLAGSTPGVCPPVCGLSRSRSRHRPDRGAPAFRGPQFGTVMPPLRAADGAESEPMPARRPPTAAPAGATVRNSPKAVVERLEHELRSIVASGFCRLFSDRARYRPAQPAHLRPRIGCRLPGRLLPGNHQCLSAQTQSLLRAVFKSRAETTRPTSMSILPGMSATACWQGVLSQHRGHAAMVSNHVCFSRAWRSGKPPKSSASPTAKSAGCPGGCRTSGAQTGRRARAFERELRKRPRSRGA